MPPSAKPTKKGKGKSHSAQAGIVFPVGRTKKHMKIKEGGSRVSHTAPVYMAAVLEYFVAEILEASSNAAREEKKNRITPHHILAAIRGDEELNEFFRDVIITAAGYIPDTSVRFLSA